MKYKFNTTRASLVSTAALHSRTFTGLVVGAAALSSSALAGDNFWNGSASNDWNNSANWSLGRVPSKSVDFDNAIINTLTSFPVVTVAPSAVPNDIKLGVGGGNSGRVDQSGGLVSAGNGNWSVFGEGGGNGTYNLADTTSAGVGLTGFGIGSGSYSTRVMFVGRDGGAMGSMNVNTTGTMSVFNDMYVGHGATGIIKWDAGTLTRGGDGGWFVIGRDGDGRDGNGTFNISGGTINASNDTLVGLDSGSIGNLNQTGGSYTAGGVSIGRDGGNGTWTVSGAATQFTSTGEIQIGWKSGSVGKLQVNAGTVSLKNWVNVGRDGGTGTLEMTGGTMGVERALRIGFGTGGVGTLTMSGGAQITGATLSETIVIGGDKGNGTATVTDAASLSSVGEFHVGNDDNSVGQLTVSGGTVSSGSWFGIGRNGSTGTLTISGTGTVIQGATDSGSRLELTNFNKRTTATLNLDGGTLMTSGIVNGAGGTCNVFLNGGLIKPRIQNYFFLRGMTNVTVKAGGALIDTDSHDIMIEQSMIGDGFNGGLTKSGTGTLFLNGTNTYTGATTVTNGELSGNGSVSGPLVVQSGAIYSPGYIYGPFGAGNTTVAGSYAYDVDASDSDVLNVTGALNLSATTDSLDFRERGDGATLPVYVIATYASLTGTFGTVTNLPFGYALNYGANQMTITRPLTAYESWLALAPHFPGETDPAIIGPDADPDGDRDTNSLEFALGGNPNSGSDNAKIYHFKADSEDAGSEEELLITIAVRNGGDGVGLNPVFSPAVGGQPAALEDGMTYIIEGGADLSFTGTVSVVDTVVTGLPAAPSGYEYRSFSLDGSNGLAGKGFMRVKIQP